MTDLDRQMQEDSPDNSGQLNIIKQKIAERRHLDHEVKIAEDRLAELKKVRRVLELETLPTLFAEAGVTTVGVSADGNSPAMRATLQDYVHANIATTWPEAKRKDAFETLEALGEGGLIRRTVSVHFPANDDSWRALAEVIEKHTGRKPLVQLEVPWQTLTAAIRDRIKSSRQVPTASQLDKIGAYVGKIVKLKPQQE